MRIPNTLRAAFKLSADGDAWANVQDWRFAVAELIYHTIGVVPGEWEFHHAEGLCSFPDTWAEKELLSLWDLADNRFVEGREKWHYAELVHFGYVLNRYADILRAQGKDY